MNEKTCAECQETLPLTMFSRHSLKKDGLRSTCKPCEAARTRARYARKKGSPVRPWRSDVPADVTYNLAHKRLRRARGSASGYACVCGQPAHAWAYDHADPDEILGTTGTDYSVTAAYSLKPEHYRPLCRSCHAKEDTQRRLRNRVAVLEAELASLREHCTCSASRAPGADGEQWKFLGRLQDA